MNKKPLVIGLVLLAIAAGAYFTLRGSHGTADSPVCWMLTSYATGFSDYHFGRDTYFKEVACCAAGAERCRIIGKPLEQWEDHEALRAARCTRCKCASARALGGVTSSPKPIGRGRLSRAF